MLADPTSPDAVSQEINIVPMNFRTEYRPDKENPSEYREVHAVDLVKKGSNGESTPWTITALQRNEALWHYVKPFYERWKEGQEDPVEGTPIDVLPFIPPGVVGHLRNLLIRSAEDLAALTDNDMQRVGMGARGWRDKARAYLENKQGEAKLAAMLSERDAEISQLTDQIEELKQQVNSLTPKKGKK